jgi:hypothetical protein
VERLIANMATLMARGSVMITKATKYMHSCATTLR